MESPRMKNLLILATLLALGACSSAQNKRDFVECLTIQFQSSNSAPVGIIYTPRNASYASLLLSFNQRPTSTFPERPQLIITPFHESEIQAAIYCSRKLGLQIRVRSGGHDYEGLSYTSENPFVTVDMRNIRLVLIDNDEKTAWVQVGATLGELYHTLARNSKTLAFTAGVCPPVGVGGHFSGGGYGMMSRKHALAADNIIDAKLINANGQVLDRKSMGEDLFWAIRGGGGTSFGIVLAFKVKLVTVPEIVTVFNVSRTLEQNATQLVHRWQYIADKVDENFLLRLYLSSVRSPIHGNRTIQAYFTTLFLGRVHDLLPLMQDSFPELGLVEQDCIEMSWIESTLFFARFRNESLDVLLIRTPQNEVYFKGKSDYVTQPIPVQGLRGIWRFLNEEDENNAVLECSPYGGVLNTFSESETPFPHRAGNIFMIHSSILWTLGGTAESERHMNWIRRLYSYMGRYVSRSPRAAYFNYRDLDLGRNAGRNTSYEQASVWGFKYFKNNFKRLVRVKSMVDPSNFFRNEQSVPPLSLS
ncbi:hypothetical protein BUALT_Bualt13G0085100 [Buddleja alternifolia]|uniref:FAD-binding PCMH-type domain-containing protein n=1 Tax=Buddleja alternifolia TaxID=168488 RepID=A0AAV6WLK1_9LAMI|nr:hypothetical protein BUALT_Bualt13G0085100 [Buddleja alternifolia]